MVERGPSNPESSPESGPEAGSPAPSSVAQQAAQGDQGDQGSQPQVGPVEMEEGVEYDVATGEPSSGSDE